MHTRRFYMMKADDCLTTAASAGEAAERLALLKIAQSYMLLADYVLKQDEQESSHRENGRQAAQASPPL
jgi:hypothetical protein